MRYQAYRPPPVGAIILADLPRFEFLGRSLILYPCSACGVEGSWGPGWEWYGSWLDYDHGYVLEIRCPDCPRETH